MRAGRTDRALTAADTFVLEIRELRLRADTLGIVAPSAGERTALQKQRRPNAIPVVDGKTLVLQYSSVYFHIISLSLECGAFE